MSSAHGHGHGSHDHGPASKEQKITGLIISTIAILLAVVSMVTNKVKTEVMLTRIELNDGWSFYQAKRVRRSMAETSMDQLSLTRSTLPQEKQKDVDALLKRYSEDVAKYKEEAKEIEEKAKDLEAETKVLSTKIEYYEIAETLLHVSIVVCSITLLVSQAWYMRAGIMVAVVAAGVAAYAYFAIHGHVGH